MFVGASALKAYSEMSLYMDCSGVEKARKDNFQLDSLTLGSTPVISAISLKTSLNTLIGSPPLIAKHVFEAVDESYCFIMSTLYVEGIISSSS